MPLNVVANFMNGLIIMESDFQKENDHDVAHFRTSAERQVRTLQ